MPDLIHLPQLSYHLLQWYDEHKRDLPWRRNSDPYAVWISEIMLQQTQVKTVIPYYERFMAQVPDVAALAALEQTALHKLWEGLGYYSRADNLHKAAKQMMRHHDGELPDTYDALLKMPGIGPYTAGAIASIAFGERRAAVDGNVYRIFARLAACDAPINETATMHALRTTAEAHVPAARPGDFNQALMDLGATVCLPNGAPHCEVCPCQSVCRAHAANLTGWLPRKTPKRPRRVEARTILLLMHNHTIYLQKRPAKGLLAGLWEFINEAGTLDESTIHDRLAAQGLQVSQLTPLGPARHLFTHIEWKMTGWLVTVANVASDASLPGCWVSADALDSVYALPSAYRYYRDHIQHFMP